ncbi:AraC family transcriptional regulator [Draconibacterium sp. IB214405]|uniref:helix-turn-helix domain-containing protein n=1 Tax=Draconibacterium sp. IB214405 TaxID=3097352 RepID=UPI002A11E549|nr:AraC family transcriptional regulator [Draconibacterium sp. IB214405]MDX8339062.1 AraC family transcriptional regulator [Draconibacterium sp. IB214405]
MDQSEKITLWVKEGASINYFKSLKEVFGGEYTENRYELKRGRTDILFYNFPICPGFDIMVNSAIHYQAVEMIREADNDPDYFHFNLIREGRAEQNISNEEKLAEAGTSTGVFINNGLFPMRSNFPANVLLKSVAIKITREALQKLMPEAQKTLETLFENNDPIFYHTHLPAELASLMDDMFHFKKSEFGRIPLIMARGLELFTLLMRSVSKLVDKDELHGLHIDDYNRLLKLKDQLLSCFDQRISLEELASEFGISVSKLKRDFKTLFNTSVYNFYTHAKMDEAYRRLKTGNFSVMEVGYDLGYQNLSKFSSMFKKIKGINPKEVLPL